MEFGERRPKELWESFRFLFKWKNACKEKLLYFFANNNKVLVSMALQVFT